MLTMPVENQKKAFLILVPAPSPRSPEGGGVVRVNVIRNEELAVLDDRVRNHQLSPRVCRDAKHRKGPRRQLALAAPPQHRGHTAQRLSTLLRYTLSIKMTNIQIVYTVCTYRNNIIPLFTREFGNKL